MEECGLQRAFRCASSDEQRGDLGLYQTYDASGAIKPVPRHRKKGYAVDVLVAARLTQHYTTNCKLTSHMRRGISFGTALGFLR